jgi:predicted HAD superfamily hydrolase
MKTYSLVTTDVWDTLIRRSCHPEAIKFQTARIFRARHAKDLLDANLTIEKIYLKRLSIERAQGAESKSKDLDDEYTIHSVFCELIVSLTNISEPEISAAVNLLVDTEVQVEISNTYADPSIMKKINDASSNTVIFLSDFYMPAKQLSMIINASGLNTLVPSGIVSCDVGLNKRSGNLFKHLIDKQNYDVSDWFHIGDNEHSDVLIPKSFGISCDHHNIEEEENKKHELITLFQDKSKFFDFIQSESIRAEQCIDNLKIAGLQLSVLFAGFCEFIAEKFNSGNFQKIAFITREGEFLKEIFDQYIAANQQYSEQKIPTTLLEVSRFSLITSKSFDLDRYANIWSQYGLRGVKKFLLEHGITEQAAENLITDYRFEDDEIVTNPALDKRVIKMLSDERFSSQNARFSDDRFEHLRNYLEHRLGSGTRDVLLVDVGWFGTCQDLLEDFFPEMNFAGAYLGIRRRNHSKDISKSGYIFDEPAEKPNSELSRFGEVFEVITSSQSASAVGYCSKDGNPKVVLDQNHQSDEASNEVPKLQQAIISGSTMISRHLHKSRVDHGDMLEQGISDCLDLFKGPPEQLANLYFDSKRHDAFRESVYTNRSNLPILTSIIKSLYDRSVREEVIFFYKSMQWSEGLKFQVDELPFYKRSIYRTLFVAAQLWKKIR